MTITPDQLPPSPVAPRVPSVRELHGEAVADDYAWMRDPNDPALHTYLEAERAYYDAQSEHLGELTDTLAREAAGRVPTGAEESVSWERGGCTYRMRIPHDAEQWQLLRRRSEKGSDEVILDDNIVAKETGFADIGVREPSPDGSLLAWSADKSGAEFYELRIRNPATGEDLPEIIARTSGAAYTTSGVDPNVAWSVDSEHLFYMVPDELHREFQVWRHRVGTPAVEDVLVLEEPDQRFDLILHASRSGRLGIVTAMSRDTTEVRVIRLESPLEDPVTIEPRRRGVEYRVDHAVAGDLYVVTDDGATEFALMRAPLTDSGRSRWTPVRCEAIAPVRSDTRLLRCDVFADHLLLSVRRNGATLLAIADRDGGGVREIHPGVETGSIRVEHAHDYDGGSVIVAEESLIEPTAWHRLDLATGDRQLLKQLEVAGYEPARYRTERRTAPAVDGTPIPVTLAYREDTALDGSAPCLLYGYGAYEYCVDAEHHPDSFRTLPSLLDRGVVYAVAHVRGGGECGRSWWHQGRLLAKPTTFTDFIAVADWLAGATGPALVDGTRIVSRGASAGGLLAGAVFSMRPDRWRAVVAEVPFVDVVNTMLDPTIPLTVNEWDEWGDPRDPEDYACMRSYAPYENLPSGARPALLMTGALHDARVMIAEPAKWAASLRATDTAGSRLLFRAELGAGAHTGATARSARFAEEAEILAFILDAMGITA